MDYKNHQIEVSVRFVSGRWIADVFVTYNENGKSMLETLLVKQPFATPSEAEQGGVEFAKKWIDEKTPE